MRLPTHIFALTVAAILLLISVPYGLVQLDIIAAGKLRIIPSLIAIVIAVGLIATVIMSRRGRQKRS